MHFSVSYTLTKSLFKCPLLCMKKSVYPKCLLPITKWYSSITKKPSTDSILTIVYCLINHSYILVGLNIYKLTIYPNWSLQKLALSSGSGIMDLNTHQAHGELDKRTWWARCFESIGHQAIWATMSMGVNATSLYLYMLIRFSSLYISSCFPCFFKVVYTV